MKFLKRATREWVSSFNSYPTSLIVKLYYDQMSVDGIYEVTPIMEGDSVWSNSLQGMYEIIKINREDNIATLQKDGEEDLYDVELCDVSLEPYSLLPMWGTMWSFGDSADEWWASKEKNQIKMAEAGLRLYDTEDLGIIFGIDGAGYNFYEAHWMPLYKARGLQWHHQRTGTSSDLELLLKEYFKTDHQEGYSMLVDLINELEAFGVIKNALDIIESLERVKE